MDVIHLLRLERTDAFPRAVLVFAWKRAADVSRGARRIGAISIADPRDANAAPLLEDYVLACGGSSWGSWTMAVIPGESGAWRQPPFGRGCFDVEDGPWIRCASRDAQVALIVAPTSGVDGESEAQPGSIFSPGLAELGIAAPMFGARLELSHLENELN